jgi:hypothetical protein
MSGPHQSSAVYDGPIRVIVRPAQNPGWFEVHTKRSRLCITQFPLRDVARGLLARGHLPEAPIIFQFEFSRPAVATTLAEAAQSQETFWDHNIIRPAFGRARSTKGVRS